MSSSPAEAQRRAERAALGGVVVDHVEDHLEPGGVQRLDHRLELVDLLAAVAGRAVGVVRGEEADRVVAPVVRQTGLGEVRLGHELVGRQQLHGRDAEVLEVVHRGVGGEPGVRAADLLGHLVVQLGEALDVQLVDDRVGPLVTRPDLLVVSPVEVVPHDHRLRDVRRGVGVVARPGMGGAEHVVVAGGRPRVAVDRAVRGDRPADRPGVGVEQQLGGVEDPAAHRLPRTVDAEPVALSRLHARECAVPDAQRLLGQRPAGLDVLAGRCRRTGTARPRSPRERTPRSWCSRGPTWHPAVGGCRATRSSSPGHCAGLP